MKSSLVFDHYPLHKPPTSWATARVAEIARTVQSGFPTGEHNALGSGVPHLRPMNVNREGRLDLSVMKHVVGEVPRELESGDVLFNNTNSPELVGKTAVVLTSERFAYSNHMTRICLEPGVNPTFVANQLHFLWMSGYFRHRCVNHVNQASISAEPLSQTVPLALPPSREQERIADALDELFSDLDAAVAALDRVRKKLKLYRASVLKAAVEGTLTAEWREQHPDVEPASQLLQRILAERRRLWEEDQLGSHDKASPTRSSRAYKDASPSSAWPYQSLPASWTSIAFGQSAWKLRSGTSTTALKERTFFPVLKSSAVRSGRIDFSDVSFLPPTAGSDSEKVICPGDLLITRLSGSVEYVGCCALVRDLPEVEVRYPDRLFSAKLVPGLEGRFVVICFAHSDVRVSLEEAAKSTAGHQRISLTDLTALVLPLPPLAEQEAIVEIVEAQLSVIDHLEADLDAKLKSAQALRQSILRRAFSGRLVPQDPNDEPAIELLARIAAERSSRASTAPAAKRQTRPRRRVAAGILSE